MGCCVYSSVAEGCGRGVASGLRLEGRLCSMLSVMLGGDFVILVVRVRIRVGRILHTISVRAEGEADARPRWGCDGGMMGPRWGYDGGMMGV